MNTKVAVILFGLAVAVSAAEYGKLRMRHNNPAPPKTYPQQPVTEEPAEDPVPQYAAPKPVAKPSTRVVQEPAAPSYGSAGSGGYSRVSSATKDRLEEAEAAADEQNHNAKYSFGSAIDDGIMDHSHVRQESRDGLKVEGSYAYSDGYFKRVVNYVADENGYRVVSESVEPISESGPKVDLVNGKAEIHTQISGVDTQYEVSAGEINSFKKVKA